MFFFYFIIVVFRGPQIKVPKRIPAFINVVTRFPFLLDHCGDFNQQRLIEITAWLSNTRVASWFHVSRYYSSMPTFNGGVPKSSLRLVHGCVFTFHYSACI